MPASAIKRRPGLFLIVVAYLGFISLGLPDSVFGIAQPYVRATFGIEIGVVGWFFITSTTGYFISSAISGPLVNWMGVGKLLAASCFMTGLALLGYTLVPAWGWMVLLGFLAGGGAGAIDAGINSFVAANYPPSLMYWLHAFYGVGATLGPIIMSSGIAITDTWRTGYIVLAGTQFAMGAVFLLTASRWQVDSHDEEEDGKPAKAVPLTATVRRPIVWLGILAFFLYTGVEVSLGQWSYTLFFEGRSIPADVASWWVAIYWGLFTFGRISAGFITRWMRTETFMRLNVALGVAAALLLALNPFPTAGVFAVGALGFALAPIFPAMIAATADRVGKAHASNAIGFQVSAAAAGAAFLPVVSGVAAQAFTLEVIPLLLLGSLAAVLVMNELMIRNGNKSKRT